MPKSTIFPGKIGGVGFQIIFGAQIVTQKKTPTIYIRLCCIHFYTKTRWSSIAFDGESLKLNSPTPKNLTFKRNLEQKMSSTCLFTCVLPSGSGLCVCAVSCFGAFSADIFFKVFEESGKEKISGTKQTGIENSLQITPKTNHTSKKNCTLHIFQVESKLWNLHLPARILSWQMKSQEKSNLWGNTS